jgi:electron transport complex protein RnfC
MTVNRPRPLIERLRTAWRSPRWGVHPDDHKRPAADIPLRVMPVPRRLYVPLMQHIGAPAELRVAIGQKVLAGELIAAAQGAVSAPVHAPSSGIVVDVAEVVAPHPSGLTLPAVIIETDGKDHWIEREIIDDPLQLSPEEISRRVAAAGIVGLGGAAFPSAVKLAGSRSSGVASLLVNGAECEPYLSCDDRLMRDRAAAIIEGLRIVRYATGAAEAIIGIEDNKPEALAAMRDAAAGEPTIQVRSIPAHYPMGSEKQLVQTLIGHEIPAGGRPSDVGALVHNVGTLAAVRRAVCEGRPLVSRLVTVGGAAVRAPGNIEVRIGTLASDLLDYCGGLAKTPARMLLGGPMMGFRLSALEVPIVKGTSGLLLLGADEVAEQAPGPCIRCGSCVSACPCGLLPLEMSRHVQAGDLDGAVALGLKDCLSCGCCAYVCPAHLPLVQSFHYARGELAARARAESKLESAKRLARARTERLEREAREKAEAAAQRRAAKAAQAAASGNAAQAGAAENVAQAGAGTRPAEQAPAAAEVS